MVSFGGFNGVGKIVLSEVDLGELVVVVVEIS